MMSVHTITPIGLPAAERRTEISRAEVCQLLAEGLLPASRVGDQWQVSAADLAALQRARRRARRAILSQLSADLRSFATD